MIKNKNSHKKTAVIFCVVLLLFAGAVGLYMRDSGSEPNDSRQDGVNYRPPTEDEKSAGDRKKEEIVDDEQQQNQPQPDGANKKTVSVAITDAGQYGAVVEVRSFIPSYSQDGTCTLSFSQGSRLFTRTTPGYKDVSSTVCPAVEVKVSDFPNTGEWQVVVSFESTNAKGQSDPKIFTIN